MGKLARIAGVLTVLAEDSYHMQHRAPGKEGAPAYDVTLSGVYPQDVYSRPDWYMTLSEQSDRESWNQVIRSRGNPKARVVMYRAVPKSIHDTHKKADKLWAKKYEGDRPQVIHPGDWVSLSKTYAEDHAVDLEGPGVDGVVVKKQVFADQVYTNGDSINEWGYWPA